MIAIAIQEADAGGGFALTSTVLLLVGLALVPLVLAMTTSFLKLVVVGRLLGQALGLNGVPPNSVISGLALVLTLHVMHPVAVQCLEAYEAQAEDVDVVERISTAVVPPMREFLLQHSTHEDRALFEELASRRDVDLGASEEYAGAVELMRSLVPAFVLRELTEAFQIGFLLFVPFLVVDLIVGTVLLALGMQMMSPTVVSLPFKLALFVLVDGWSLLLTGLVQSYA